MNRERIESEVQRRAEAYLRQEYLLVDYYRIRRKLAYRLPVRGLSLPSIEVPSIRVYPWATWMLWELEERIACLGWAAEWFGNSAAREAATRDLAALSDWPEYRQYGGPDLSSGHAGRILWRAYNHWEWPDRGLRTKIEEACKRHVEMVLPGSDELHSRFQTKEDLLRLEDCLKITNNIPFIGTLGVALTASVARHECRETLNDRVQAILGAILEMRSEGVLEGVSYDGYFLDFVADWLTIITPEDRRAILEHPSFPEFLEESYMLGVPGRPEEVVEFSDVEAREMPFHLSAQAKIQHLQPNAVREWHLCRCDPEWLRADGLAALHEASEHPQSETPQAGALNAHYAVVLRTGWESEDTAAAVSCTKSPMSHIQRDNGTLAIGTHGRWIITDPGYQQYVKDEERDFTLGPTAHNTPVINGLAQTEKKPELLALEGDPEGICRMAIDLTACYPEDLNLESVVRTLWLGGKDVVVVADQIRAASVGTLAYHWHGHPDAAWWVEDGWVLLHLPETNLWFKTLQAEISDANIQRLPGSRGQLTYVSEVKSTAPAVWWIFAIGDEPPTLTPDEDGRGIVAMENRFVLERS